MSETFVLVLERLLVLQIENYPKLSKKIHPRIFMSVMKVLLAVATKGALFKGFLNRVGKYEMATDEVNLELNTGLIKFWKS